MIYFVSGRIKPRRLWILLILVYCIFSCTETPPPRPVVIPKIEEPDFSITSIKILQAELVNTRLTMKLHIDNPNPFPVDLSSFRYELYGEGRFWADGTEKNVCTVPASGYTEKDLYLVMNFIDMKRDILDKIINMERVDYRFTGTVEIVAKDMAAFTKTFDLKGESEVDR
ncbi:MAG: LEA type 2 family protein [Treponema sp.]|nr:LEA type 2 family protein [Treponema sp.]